MMNNHAIEEDTFLDMRSLEKQYPSPELDGEGFNLK